jgi:hydrogenase maturation protease
MGNPILCDDAVGIRLTRDVAARLGPRPGLEVIEECTVGGLNLLDLLEGRERVLVIDSIKTAGGTPGAWYRFDAGALRETMNLRNVHDTNFATALELGRQMGMALPRDEDIHVFAVEIDDNMTFSEELSPALAAAYDDLVVELTAEAEGVLSRSTRP